MSEQKFDNMKILHRTLSILERTGVHIKQKYKNYCNRKAFRGAFNQR